MTGGLPARGDAEPTPGIRQRCERKDAKGGGANAGCRVHQAGKVRTQGKKSAEGRIHFLSVCSVTNEEEASKDEKQEVKLVEIREGRRKEIKRRKAGKAESWCRGEITKSSKETKGRKRGRQKAAEEQDGQRKRGKKKFGKDKGSNN